MVLYIAFVDVTKVFDMASRNAMCIKMAMVGSLLRLIVKSMQRSGTEAFRTQIKSSKLKREIIHIKNSKNTKDAYGHPSEQLFSQKVVTQ